MYKLLSLEAVVALKKYNTEAINKSAKKRGIHVTDIADHESPPSENTTHEELPDPHQFDGAPQNEIDPILDYINSQHLKILQRKSKFTNDMSLLEPTSPSITWFIGEPMEV